MEQSPQHNEQQFEKLLAALQEEDGQGFIMVTCSQPSWAISVIEQLEGEIEASQIVLDWQTRQLDSINEYLEESDLMEALEQNAPDTIHIVGLENSLLTEILTSESTTLATWNEEVATLEGLANQVVIWTDAYTSKRITQEASGIQSKVALTIDFEVDEPVTAKEPNEDQNQKIEGLEAEEQWYKLGQEWIKLGNIDKASTYVDKLLNASPDDASSRAKAHLLKGQTLDRQGLWQMALTNYKLAHDIIAEAEQSDLSTEVSFRIANIFATHNRPEIALEWYEKAVEIGSESSPVFVAKSHRNMGLIQAQHGDIDSSFEHLEQALDGLEEAEEWDSLAYTHQQVADIFVKLQQIGDAVTHHQAAANFFAEIKDFQSQGNNYERMARLSQYKGHISSAVKYYQKAIEAFNQTENHKVIAETHQKLGALHQDQMNWSDALTSFQSALPHAESLEDDFLIESLKDSIENMQEKATAPEKKKGKGFFGSLFGK